MELYKMESLKRTERLINNSLGLTTNQVFSLICMEPNNYQPQEHLI